MVIVNTFFKILDGEIHIALVSEIAVFRFAMVILIFVLYIAGICRKSCQIAVFIINRCFLHHHDAADIIRSGISIVVSPNFMTFIIHQGISITINRDVIKIRLLIIAVAVRVTNLYIVSVVPVLLPCAGINIFYLALLIKTILHQQIGEIVPRSPVISSDNVIGFDILLLHGIQCSRRCFNISDQLFQILILISRFSKRGRSRLIKRIRCR